MRGRGPSGRAGLGHGLGAGPLRASLAVVGAGRGARGRRGRSPGTGRPPRPTSPPWPRRPGRCRGWPTAARGPREVAARERRGADRLHRSAPDGVVDVAVSVPVAPGPARRPLGDRRGPGRSGRPGRCVSGRGRPRRRSSSSGPSTAASSSRTTSRTRTAPALSSGSLPLPHLGDCTQDGQPLSHSQLATVARVACSQRRSTREAALAEAGAARVAVVDEDRRRPGVGVQRGREAAEVPAVAGRQQREDADRGVLRGVQRPGQLDLVDLGPLHRPVVERQPDRPRPQLPGGQVEGELGQHLAGAQPPPLVGHHLVGHVDDAGVRRDRAEPAGHARSRRWPDR